MGKKIIGLVAVFVACAVLGYFACSFIVPGMGDEKGGGTHKSASTKAVSGAGDKSTTSVPEQKVEMPELKLIKEAVWDEAAKKYKFQLEKGGSAAKFYLTDKTGKDVPYDYKAGFILVAPTKDEAYLAYVTDSTGTYKSKIITIAGCKPRIAQVTPVTVPELQGMIDARDVNAANAKLKGRTVGTVNYSFSGVSEEDRQETEMPRHINAVIDRLNLGTWSSATVTGVKTDDSGRLQSVSISVSY